MEESTALLLPASDDWRELAGAANDIFSQLMPNSRRLYRSDLKAFVLWMHGHELTPASLARSQMIEYQRHLLEDPRPNGKRYARATVARMIASVRSVLTEYSLATGHTNPAVGLRPIKVNNESTHVALTRPQAQQLLRLIDRSTLLGLRNYALVSLLLRTGIRRSECADLTVGDLDRRYGHHVATITHGKGDKRRVVKIPVDVWHAIETYREAASLADSAPDAPLFVQIRRGGHVQAGALGTKGIERLVKDLGQQIREDKLTPHGLRATFATLTLEAHAPLDRVQEAMGHSKTETTLRYHKRKLNLDDNAVDYLHFA